MFCVLANMGMSCEGVGADEMVELLERKVCKRGRRRRRIGRRWLIVGASWGD